MIWIYKPCFPPIFSNFCHNLQIPGQENWEKHFSPIRPSCQFHIPCLSEITKYTANVSGQRQLDQLHWDLCFFSMPPPDWVGLQVSTPFWVGLSGIFMSSRSPGLIRSQTSKLCHQLQRHLWLDAPEWWAIYVPSQTSYSLLGKEKKSGCCCRL